MKLAGFHGFVPQLFDIAADDQSRRAFLDNKRAHAPVRGLGRGIRLGEQQKLVSTVLYPSFSISRLTISPGAPFSITNALMPRCAGLAEGSVLASSRNVFPRRPFVTHIFDPLTRYTAPSRVAVVEMF